MRRGARGHAARWRSWGRLGLLVTLVFLVHDFGMAGLAPASELRFAPEPGVASGAHVMHVASAGGEALPARDGHQHLPGNDEPAVSGCEIAWAAIRAGSGPLAGVMQAMLSAPAVIVPDTGAENIPRGADAASRTPHEQRVFFQVFLI